MKRIFNQSHNKETYFFALSRLFERASYVGIRVVLILYMIDKVSLNMSRPDALSIYGWVAGLLILSKTLGGVLGDLVIGNRNSIVLGGIMHTVGAFTLSLIPSTIGLYIGLAFIILGGGLYSPNLIANFGKEYSKKTKLLDAGFTILHISVIVGAGLGALLIGWIVEIYSYQYGFVLAGLLMIISIMFPIFFIEKEKNDLIEKTVTVWKRMSIISIFLIIVALYWIVYEISKIGTMDIEMQIKTDNVFNIPNSSWSTIETSILFITGLIMAIIWTYYFNNRIVKLLLGFTFGALSFAIILFIPETSTEGVTSYYLVSLVLLGISETHIVPIIRSVLTKYSNPKYLAIIISLAFIPMRLISMIFHAFDHKFYDTPMFALKFGILSFLTLALGLIIYRIVLKNTTYNIV